MEEKIRDYAGMLIAAADLLKVKAASCIERSQATAYIGAEVSHRQIANGLLEILDGKEPSTE